MHRIKVVAGQRRLSSAVIFIAILLSPIVLAQELELNIAKQRLSDALMQLAGQANVQIVFPVPEAVARFSSNGLSGRYQLEEALQILLSDTELWYLFTNENTVVIAEREPVALGRDSEYPDQETMSGLMASQDNTKAINNAAGDSETNSAQETHFESKSESDSRRKAVELEEIIVTAQKTAKNLQDVAVSATVFSRDQLDALGASRVKDLEFNVPNFVFTGGTLNVQTSVTMRGISSNTRNIGFEAGISMYVDGVYTGRSMTFNQDLMDVERVEVLRGPQGTFFGKNTIAGAVSITTRKPAEEFGGNLSLDVGNYEYIRARASLDVPLIDGKLYSKFTAFGVDRDGFVTNVFDGTKLDTQGNKGGRLQLRATPSEALEINFSFDNMVERRRSTAPDIIGGIGANPMAPPRKVSLDITPLSERDLHGALLSADYTYPSGHVLTSLTGWRSSDFFFFNDGDGSERNQFSVTFWDNSVHLSEELRIASPRGGRLEYVAGLYYFNQKAKTHRQVDFYTFFPIPGTFQYNFGDVESTSVAAFANADFRLTDKLSLNAGLRYTDERKDLFFNQRSEGFFDIFGNTHDLFDIRRKQGDDGFSPTIGLSWQVSPNVMSYVKYSQGFKSGGFNADFVSGAGEDLTFGPENTKSYEIGLKSEMFDRRLRVNFAGFFMKHEDLQISSYIAATDTFQISNAASSKIKGIELDVTALPTPDLLLIAGIGYTNAEFDDFQASPTVNFSGEKLQQVPEVTANFSARYSHRLGRLGELAWRVEGIYRDSWFSGVPNVPQNEVPSFTVYNGRVDFTPDNGNWRLALWSRNLTDNLYARTQGLRTIPGGPTQYLAISRGDPRTYGLSWETSF